MTCYRMLQARGLKMGLKLPVGLATDEEIQKLLNANDHEAVHEALQYLPDQEIYDLIMKILEDAKKKKKRAYERCVAQEARTS